VTKVYDDLVKAYSKCEAIVIQQHA
jgi:hypothetical protein